nr:hypothetical protein [Tanacetum cinerariifolium]
MTSFGYRLNPHFANKECSSCGTLYTSDCSCSTGNVEDKILVPKPPKNCARCARCGYPVDGPYCQGCTFLRKKLEEDLVTHFQGFQNTFESSDDSTNIVNAPRKPFVVKQDHGSFVDKIICDLNKDPDSPHLHTFSPNQFHCFHCKDVLGDGEACQRCTCKRCVSGLSKGLCYICGNNQNSINDSLSISANSSHNPPQIDERCYECGDALDGIFVNDALKKLEEKRIEEEQAANAQYWKIPACCDDDDDYNSAITPVAEIVISEDEEIKDDNLCEKLLNINLLIAKIEALKDNPTPSSEILTKSSSTSPKSFLEETNTFHNSLLEFENFYFDLKEISSGSTATHSDISLPDYEVFYFDDNHIKEISSGSTTTHSDISLSEYDSFIFDLSNDQFPPTNRSDFTHEEFADELAYIISSPEYDCFYFRNLPDTGELISILNSGIRENSSTTRVNLPVEDDHSPLLAYVVWVFLFYLTYPIIPPYLHSFRNQDTIFDPGITINHFCSFKPGLSHR